MKVVFASYARVQVLTVMIKILTAAFTSHTMVALDLDKFLADLTPFDLIRV